MGDGREALLPLLTQQVAVGGGQELLGAAPSPSRPPNAPESSRARVPASTPLPDTSTSATSRVGCRRRSGSRRGSRRRTTRRRRSGARPRPTSRPAAPASRPGRAAGRAGRPASSRRGCPGRPGARGCGQERARSPRSRPRRGPRPATPAGRPPARSRSTITAATTTSSSSRLRTVSRKPPTSTTSGQSVDEREPATGSR